jgi:hypothetical protein
VRTATDVSAGEELTAEYLAGLSLFESTADRQQALKKTWGFRCRCPRCLGKEGKEEEEVVGGGDGSGEGEGGGDPLDVPPSRGWQASAAVAMGAVERGASGAGDMLQWLLDRQRKAAFGHPSYAEQGIRVALVRFFVLRAHSEAAGTMMPPVETTMHTTAEAGSGGGRACQSDDLSDDEFDEGRALRRHASTLTRHGSRGTSLPSSEEEKKEEEDPRQSMGGEGDDGSPFGSEKPPANLSAVMALADQLPFFDACVHDLHPMRVPALVAAALVADGTARRRGEEQEEAVQKRKQKEEGGEDDDDDDDDDDLYNHPDDAAHQQLFYLLHRDALLAEAVRVHDAAFGGDVEFFCQRYGLVGSGESDASGVAEQPEGDTLDRLLAAIQKQDEIFGDFHVVHSRYMLRPGSVITP